MATVIGHMASDNLLPERSLWSFHIFMITISGTIGVGFASSASEILGITGPGGALLAFGVVGAVACFVMEGICEMLIHWAIPNPMVEFVRVFVDRDLAVVVGFAYWYTYAITFAALLITTGNLLNFWSLSFAWKTAVFVIVTLAIILLNTRSVFFFGNVEAAGGILKLTLVLGLFILMILLDRGVGPGHSIGFTCFNDGVRNNSNVATSHFKAVLVAISLAVFPYIGVELVTITAFEAKDPAHSLRFTAKNIAYIVSIIYVLSVFAFTLNVEWFNQALPAYYRQGPPDLSLGVNYLGHLPLSQFLPVTRSQTLPVIAALQSGLKTLPGLITATLAYSALSAANTALFIASRTAYGLASALDPESNNSFIRLLSRFGTVTPSTKIPGWALLVSCIFFWLPYIHLGAGYSREELQQILISLGSTSCVLVWGSQCLAFIRFHRWRKQHKEYLKDRYKKYHPNHRPDFSSWFAFLQPLPAWLGLIGCILVVLVFASVGMWNKQHLFIKAMNIYLGPAVFLLLFIILKIINRRSWVYLGDWPTLRGVLIGLEGQVHDPRFQNQIHGPREGSPHGSGVFETTDEEGTELPKVSQDHSSTNPDQQPTYGELNGAPQFNAPGFGDPEFHQPSPAHVHSTSDIYERPTQSFASDRSLNEEHQPRRGPYGHQEYTGVSPDIYRPYSNVTTSDHSSQVPFQPDTNRPYSNVTTSDHSSQVPFQPDPYRPYSNVTASDHHSQVPFQPDTSRPSAGLQYHVHPPSQQGLFRQYNAQGGYPPPSEPAMYGRD